MTTIIYHDGILVADTLSNANHICISHSKLYTCKRTGSVFGSCGYSHEMIQFMKWIDEGLGVEVDKPKFLGEDGFCCLEVNKSGELFIWYDHLVPIPIHEKKMAIGSGGGFALGAVEMGASAIEAIRVSAKLNTDTGGPFDIYDGKTITRVE